MDIIKNYSYKVSGFMSGSMFVKICVQGHVPGWYIAEDQQESAWKLFGWAHLLCNLYTIYYGKRMIANPNTKYAVP